jgi:hypothetical protein
MPNATLQFSTLNPTWDMATLRATIRDLLTGHCGFTLVEQYGSSPFNIVVSFDTIDPGSTNKQVFIRFDSTTAVASLRTEMFSAWNPASRPADNSGSGTEALSSNLNFAQACLFMAVNHPVYHGVFILNGSTALPVGFIGYWKPAIKPGWWPNDKLYAFQSNNYAVSTHALRGLFGVASPFNQTVGTTYPVSRDTQLQQPISEFGNVRSIDPGTAKVFIPGGVKGTAGNMGSDIAQVSGASLVPGQDVIEVDGVPTWQVIVSGYATGAAWAIKIA